MDSPISLIDVMGAASASSQLSVDGLPRQSASLPWKTFSFLRRFTAAASPIVLPGASLATPSGTTHIGLQLLVGDPRAPGQLPCKAAGGSSGTFAHTCLRIAFEIGGGRHASFPFIITLAWYSSICLHRHARFLDGAHAHPL